MEELEKFLKALADRTRLRILYLLMSNKNLCVCDIMNGLGMNQTTVSKALSVLKNADIVTYSRTGLWIFYTLNYKNKFISFIINLIKKQFKDDAVIKEDKKRLMRYIKSIDKERKC